MTITQEDLEYSVKRTGHVDREEWKYEGVLHSINDEPAVVINGGEEMQWWKHGSRHRDEHDGPAWVKGKSGIFTYYNLGEIHRRHGPAMINPRSLTWYHYGTISRNDGPAIISGGKAVNGKLTGEITYKWWYDGLSYLYMKDWAEAANCDPEIYVMLKLKYG